MRHLLVFRLKDNRFAIDVGTVVEVLRQRMPVFMPELPDFVTGVVDVRGDMLPVLDMRERLGLPADGTADRWRLLVVRSSLDRVALRVDSVEVIVKVPDDEIRRPPIVFRGIKKRYLEGMCGSSDDMMAILKMENILTSDERILLASAITPKGAGKGK